MLTDAAGTVDEAQWVRLNKQLLAQLPWENRLLLRYLCSFLKVVSTFQEINKMTIVNLSVCFGPNFMRPEQETMEVRLALEIYFFLFFLQVPNLPLRLRCGTCQS